MISSLLSLLLYITFLILGLIHFNWALGGKWGFAKALPTNEKGEPVLNPTKIDSAVVGFGLFLFSFLYMQKSGLLYFQIPNWILFYGTWIIPFIFIFRAIGDFKYIGFFKKIKYSEFAKADNRLFSPLCLSIGIIGILIKLLS